MASTHAFQAPKGTRDFYPPEMAVRRHIERIWREVSINHGFEEVDGPTFEHLDLYTVKSGPGIVSELFSFKRAGGETEYALRPEFTPTLARMYAAQANALPKPAKWFCMPSFFRAERPQRGRLREFYQWNIDVIGDDSPRADAEVIACCVGVLEQFGLTPEKVKVKVSDRSFVTRIWKSLGVPEEKLAAVFELLDRRSKMSEAEFEAAADQIGMTKDALRQFEHIASSTQANYANMTVATSNASAEEMGSVFALAAALRQLGVAEWCSLDLSIVRGLAYYTGTVFEVHETTGKERAIAGGGRYDKLIELFGGPSTPAVGFAMGDVVLRLVLEDHGLLEKAETYLPRPDLFVINGRDEDDAARLRPLVSWLRGKGLHARHSARATRNVGKLLGDANKARSRIALILGRELDEGFMIMKNLESGAQREVEWRESSPSANEALLAQVRSELQFTDDHDQRVR